MSPRYLEFAVTHWRRKCDMLTLLSPRLSIVAAVALTIPLHPSSALADDYPAMAAPPDYVEQQNEQQRSACNVTGLCNQSNQPGRPAPPPLPDVWGALAISPSTLGWGASWNYKDEAAASQVALSKCRANGLSDCKLAVTIADVCVSLATSPAQKIYSIGGPIGAANFADGAAILKCKQAGGQACATVTSFCADGVHHELNGHTVLSNGNPIFVADGPSRPAVAAPPSAPAHAGNDTVRFYGTWTTSFAANGQNVTLLSIHNAQGYRNFVVAQTGNIPAGDGTFSAANGRYSSSAEKPNDSGSYHFVDSDTVVCTNAAGQTVTWKRQGKPVDANVAAQALTGYAPPPDRPGNLTKK
jgi:hypothetical protein